MIIMPRLTHHQDYRQGKINATGRGCMHPRFYKWLGNWNAFSLIVCVQFKLFRISKHTYTHTHTFTYLHTLLHDDNVVASRHSFALARDDLDWSLLSPWLEATWIDTFFFVVAPPTVWATTNAMISVAILVVADRSIALIWHSVILHCVNLWCLLHASCFNIALR